MNLLRRTLPLVLCGISFGGMASADKVHFKTGDIREGRIQPVPGDPNSVELLNSLGTIRVGRDLISSIEETDDATDYAVVGEQFLDNRTYDRAVQMFQMALELDSESARAKAGMVRARQLIEAQKMEARRARVARNSDVLEDARTLLQDEKFEEVEQMIEGVVSESPTEDQKAMAESLRLELYVTWGLSRLDRLDPGGAEFHLERALAIDPSNEAANDALLGVWEQDPTKKERVAEVYVNKLKTNPNDIELNRKLVDVLLSLKRYEEALVPLAKIEDTSVYRVNKYGERHEEAMVEVARAHAGRGDLDSAIGVYEQVIAKFPRADAGQLVYWKYQKSLNELEPDDWQGRAALLAYLAENGMNTLAAQEAELILRNDPENETATALLRSTAENDLAGIMDVFGKEQYVLARSLSEEYAQANTRFPDLAQKALDINARADLEAQRQAKAAREQAREIVAQGDEYLALAQRNLELQKSSDNPNRSSVVVYKAEAEKYSKRAINAYQTALKIDPSLGPMTGGMDVNNKLADARAIYERTTKSARYIWNPN